MSDYIVAITRFEEDTNTLRKAVELSGAFDSVKPGMKVVLKPNIVIWTDAAVYPKWGVITTTRVIEDTVKVLKDLGVDDITIAEGIMLLDPRKKQIPQHAYEHLGYKTLSERYGVKYVDVFSAPFQKVPVDDEYELMVSTPVVESDFFVNLPVMKTHAQTHVSLSMKNLKGIINMAARKHCHSAQAEKPLDYYVSKLPDMMPENAVILDGIYTLERGPGPDGSAKRSDIIIASRDMYSADKVGAAVLGHAPENIPSMIYRADHEKRPSDLSDVTVVGEAIEDVASFHKNDFRYTDGDLLHSKLDKMGVQGLTFRKFDSTLCTYCSMVYGAVLTSVMMAWKGEPWDKVDILTGKIMKPIPGHNKTILLGKCMTQLNKDNEDIKELFAIKGCPPDPHQTAEALQKAGIPVNPALFDNIEGSLGFLMGKYKDKPEFEERFYQAAE
jgi:uncharacterized protein (DUF362 family)